MDPYCTSRTVGETNRQRQLAGAGLIALTAVACAVTTLAGWPLYQTLFVLGAGATLAWLADGSSRRFMGPGLAAVAIGGGITAYRALEMEAGKGEHTIVYPALGVALLIASLFNPMAIRGAGTFLVVVGSVALVDTPWNPGWSLVGLLLIWSAIAFGVISRGQDDATHDGRSQPATERGTREPVQAGSR